MNKKVILARYGEIHLKGLNRPFFEKMLTTRIREALSSFRCHVVKGDGRYYIKGIRIEDEGEALRRICSVFGVHSATSAEWVGKDMDVICETAVGILKKTMDEDGRVKATFKIRARRSDKNFPMDSTQICRHTGGYVLDKLENVTVDVHKPDYFIDIEIREDGAYIYSRIIPGVGGMPLGSNGKAVLLLSGGIDSPVAGYMMAKRGVEIIAVHFHSFPHTGEKAKQKVVSLCNELARYCGRIELNMINLIEIQTAIRDHCDERFLTLIMRRFMARLAERVAKEYHAEALVTGESLGQVASQTMRALAATEEAVQMPVFRPLIGMDKSEIVDIASKIGTYEISSLPYEDCCTLFVPRHPATKPKLYEVKSEESSLNADALLDQAMTTLEKQVITFD